MTNNNQLQRFTTEDMKFAAYLLCKGVQFRGIESTEFDDTKRFVFVGEDERIDELLLDFYNRRGQVEPQSYDEQQARLRDLLKIEKSRKRINCDYTEK